MQLRRPAESVAGPEATIRMEPLGMEQGQSSQQTRVEPVALGVLSVARTQVGCPLGRHEHGRALSSEPRRERHPGVAGRLHHDRHVGRIGPPGSMAQSWSRSRDAVRNDRPDQRNSPRPSGRLAWWAARQAMSTPSRSSLMILPCDATVADRPPAASRGDRHQTFANRDPPRSPPNTSRSPGSQQGDPTSGGGPIRQRDQQARSRRALRSVTERRVGRAGGPRPPA
jgi:hypothetical protein